MKIKLFEATEKLVAGHSLVSNLYPKGVSLTEIEKTIGLSRVKPKMEIQNFGLWEVSAPDFSKYYPDVKPEDLVPQDADFAYPVFRSLSQVIVNKYGPIDFSEEGVLESSMTKLIGQSVYPNHDTNVGNELGVVIETAWQEKKKYEGVVVPAGFNSRFKLDGKSNPKIVRNVMMDPPSVHSTSVGVSFKWEKSHPEMEENDFWSKLGTFDKEGKMIRRIVKEIVQYHEISFVTHGADPYAQKVNSKGQINNPKYAAGKQNFSAEEFSEMGTYMDFKEPKLYIFSEDHKPDPTIPGQPYSWNLNQTNENNMKPEMLAFLIAHFGMPNGTTEEQAQARLNADLPGLIASKAKLGTTETELANLKAKYPDGTTVLTVEQTAKLGQYDSMKAQHDAVMADLRAEVLKNYNLSSGGADKANAAITKLITESSYEGLTALGVQYKKLADEKFEATCGDCGGKKITRMSAEAPNEGEQKPGGNTTNQEQPVTSKSLGDASAALREKARKANANFIHGAK